MPLKPSFSPY
ncbi:hypothetical protein MTR67_030320 [Solanum verrucosum]|uniref:Uncharacterized protein n=1 Tax=Solanum verrucosum TaxID=315347 RepID=A0AAF0R9U7_SOLVR|nr:hypothetical protein MTR67_030320 [Solanum verrucosum]